MGTMRFDRDKGELDYGVIGEKFGNLLTAISNLLEREPRYQHVNSAPILFVQLFRNAINTYRTVFYIIADSPKDPLRDPKFSLSLPPLTRKLYEQLMMFFFLLEDVPAMVPYIFKTGYTERRREMDHAMKYHRTDPDWKPYMDQLQHLIDGLETGYKVTAKEKKDPVQFIGRGPTPGGLIKLLKNNRPKATCIDFMEYIQSWIYRELSGQAHLSIVEVVETGFFFLREDAEARFGRTWEKEVEERLEQYRQNQLITAITLLLAIATEVDVHFKYNHTEKLKFVWTVLNEHSDMTKDFWDRRYSALLL
jgi:hypothetical protein